MRPRRRRPRGPRPNVPGAPQGSPPTASAPAQQTPRPAGARRRRRSRRNRPSNNAPAPYGTNNNSGGQVFSGRPRERRRDRGRNGDKRRGLEVLRDLQQAGVALDPTERLILELPPGKGDPVSPPKAGKTRILQVIASSVAHNHPDVAIYALLVDERPEEVTDFKRNTPANVIAASSDMSIEDHIETAEHAMEVVASLVLEGKDVVLLLDSITRLARAYNAGSEGSGRTMSGGLDSNAMQAPRQIFGAARKIEDRGSLTIMGTALVDTGSRMDQVIFEEFKGTGNSEIFL
ncbi:MAG: transcription termination factor Rho, partial [Candidatus Eisenbacteria bacterium]